MAIVCRKFFTFQSKNYFPGNEIPGELMNSYQRETFSRVGYITEVPDKPKRSRKPVLVTAEG